MKRKICRGRFVDEDLKRKICGGKFVVEEDLKRNICRGRFVAMDCPMGKRVRCRNKMQR